MSGKNSSLYTNKIILAPMVKIGTLPTRLLALKYGADLAYSEEIIDWRLLRSNRVVNEMIGTIEYIDQTDGTIVFSTNEEEKSKLILQIGTSDPERALEVLLKVQDDISGIDVNMGCPKPFSIGGGMGAALLKKPDKVKDILTTLVTHSKIPVTCKIRVLSTLEATLELALLIENCGVSAIAIHGRNVNERPRHKNRNDFIKAISEKLQIPVIANGGSREIKCYEDILKFRENTGASSVMIARASEWNPSIFRKEGKLEMDTVIQEYLKLAVITNNQFTNTKYTIQNILRELQTITERGQKFLETSTMQEICAIFLIEDFYKEKALEWDAFKKKKRPLESESEETNEGASDPKKPKLAKSLIEESTIIIPDCVYHRLQYHENEDLPKSILLKFVKTEGFMAMPKYTTEGQGKQFMSKVEVGGKTFMTDVCEKSKKCAEQGAAMACCRFLKLMS